MLDFTLFVLSVLGIVLVWHFATRKYLNPYKLTFIFGKKGSGKTTILCKYAFQYLKKGWNVYSTEGYPGTYLIQPEDIGFYHFPPNSCIIVDEVGMCWDARNFKKFPPEVRDFFKLQRHNKLRVILASQTFDIDKKIRDLTDDMYLLSKSLRVFSYAKRILRKTVLIEAQGDSASRIDENLCFDSFLWFWCGSRRFTFIPRYARYFDSFSPSQLPEKEFPYVSAWDIPEKKILERIQGFHLRKKK